MDQVFIRNRITELRIRKNISEYQMSLDLGKNRSYIQSISSGRSLPSMKQFFEICDYFEITPHEFFDSGITNPLLIHTVFNLLKSLEDEDLLAVIPVLKRLQDRK